jgi:hypothetical protein
LEISENGSFEVEEKDKNPEVDQKEIKNCMYSFVYNCASAL